jgi:quercetin dioxygenase-like cupin family protein
MPHAKFVFAFVLFAAIAAPPAQAQPAEGAVSLLPDQVKWNPMPANVGPGAESALLTGSLTRPGGLYTLRVRLAKSGRVLPHVHPDTRYITVISGDLYSSRGERIAEENLSRFPAGSYYSVPAGAVHFVLARDGEVVFQESGIGPTESMFLKK